jgi:uncharacterized membrane-anchored protein
MVSRNILSVAVGGLLLVAANYVIYQREQIVERGHVVMLALAPVDPRSFMQGDYMALRFQIANAMSGVRHGQDGNVVLDVGDNGIGTFSHVDDGSALQANQVRMRYRVRGDTVKFATNAFFFEEGEQKRYQAARYGEFRVADNGEALLTELRDARVQPLSVKK